MPELRIGGQRSCSPSSRIQGLVRPVYRDNGHSRTRDEPRLTAWPPAGYSPSEHGPSGPVSRRGVDAFRFGGLAGSVRSSLFYSTRDPGGASERAHQRPATKLPKRFHSGTNPAFGSSPPHHKRQLCRHFLSGASRDRTGDLLLAKQIGLSTRVSWCLEKPCKSAFLLDTGGHERTARDKLVPPWCPLGVRDLGGGKRAASGLPGCVSSGCGRAPRPLLPRRSPSARRAAACPQTRPSRGHRC